MDFKYKSKLSPTKYPCLQTMNEILQWILFENGVDPYELDPVFLGRLCAMAKEEGKKHLIGSGYRSTKKQESLYLAKGGVKNSDGSYSDPHGKVNGRVARPNTSWHEFRLAVDSSDKYYKSLHENDSTNNQAKWIKFGLFKPLTIGNGIKSSSAENWHIQPLESLGIVINKRKDLAPTLIVKTEDIKPTKTPTQVLFDKRIISTLEWNDWLNKEQCIQSEYMKSLIINFYLFFSGEKDFLKAMSFIADKKLISDKSWWLDKLSRPQEIESKWCKILVERMACFIDSRGSGC